MARDDLQRKANAIASPPAKPNEIAAMLRALSKGASQLAVMLESKFPGTVETAEVFIENYRAVLATLTVEAARVASGIAAAKGLVATANELVSITQSMKE